MTSPSSSSDPTLTTLLAWLAQNGVWLDPRVHIRLSDPARPGAGYGVFARADVPYGVPVSKTPKTAVLSVRTCALGERLGPLVRPLDPNLALSIAVLSEQLLGERSRFYGYLQSFPRDGADIAMLWDWAGADGREGLRWLRGTEAEGLMQGPLLDSLERVYALIVRPALADQGPGVSLPAFRRAYSLVSSRAFQVDVWHGVGLVPVADAFNHAEENNVFMETDFAVCPSCGTLGPCAHPDHKPRHSSPWDEPMTCDMVTYAPLAAGQEVFNSYDEKGFSNAQLLVHYGFVLEGNGEDCVRWDWELVELGERGLDARAGAEEMARVELVGEAVRDAAREMAREMEGLELVVSPAESEEVDEEEDDSFWVDAEGRVSQALFLRLLARNASCAISDVPTLLHLVLSVLRIIEEAQAPAPAKSVFDGVPQDALSTLAGIARDVQTLCKKKVEGMYRPELSTSDLAALLDTPLGSRTKLALSYSLTERLMLETCATSWEDVEQFLSAVTT